MDSIALARLERMANLLIEDRLSLERCEGKFGEIYFAHGLDGAGNITGLWGYRDISRSMQFKDGTSLKKVRLTLVTDAEGFIEALNDKGLI